MTKIIAYYRVSTVRQGQSGLGLEAQQTAVEAYCRSNDGVLLGSYTEVETGKLSERPELTRALQHARRAKATLVVAKLDRLARNVAFLSALMDSEAPFVAVDNPQANRLTLHILAAVAEAEAIATSERTKAALAAFKSGNRVSKRIQEMHPNGVPPDIAEAYGGKLGSSRPGHWTGREERRRLGAKVGNVRSARVRRARARRAIDEVAPLCQALRADGLTLAQVADRLNADGWTTRRGHPWTKVAVCKVMKAKESENHQQEGHVVSSVSGVAPATVANPISK